MTDNMEATYTGMSRLRSSRGDATVDMTNYYSPAPIVTEDYDQPPNVYPANNNNTGQSEEKLDYSKPKKLKKSVQINKQGKTDWRLGEMDRDVSIQDVTREFAGLGEDWDYTDYPELVGSFGDDFEVNLERDLNASESDPLAGASKAATFYPAEAFADMSGIDNITSLGATKPKKPAPKKPAPKKPAPKKPAPKKPTTGTTTKNVGASNTYTQLATKERTNYIKKVDTWVKLNWAKFTTAQRVALKSLYTNMKKMSAQSIQATIVKITEMATDESVKKGLTKAVKGFFSFPFGKPGKGIGGALKLIGNVAVMGMVGLMVLKLAPLVFEFLGKVIKFFTGSFINIKRAMSYGKTA